MTARLALLLLALALAPAASACQKTLRWHEDAPFSMRLADGSISGLQVELHQQLLRRMGCRLELVEMPFARALAELQLGRLDLLPGTFDRPERRVYAHFSKPNLQVRNLLYVRKADLPRMKTDKLEVLVAEGWRLGVQVGVVYGPAYAELLKDADAAAKLQPVPKRNSLWQMLDLGRIDAVPADELTAPLELRGLKLGERIVASPLVLSSEATGTAISKLSNDETFVARFNAALEAMKADGSYAALLARYGVRQELGTR